MRIVYRLRTKKITEETIKLPAYIKHADKKLQDHKKNYRKCSLSKNCKVCKRLESFWDESVLHFKRQKDLNYLNTQLSQPSWIGLSSANKGDDWEWSDGSKLTTEYWSRGHSRQPNVYRKGGRGCTLIHPSTDSRNWINANCREPRNW
ncbi:hypothetical protein L345_16376, partial [Ophiophagus hannah]